jgi:hypothetical protein
VVHDRALGPPDRRAHAPGHEVVGQPRDRDGAVAGVHEVRRLRELRADALVADERVERDDLDVPCDHVGEAVVVGRELLGHRPPVEEEVLLEVTFGRVDHRVEGPASDRIVDYHAAWRRIVLAGGAAGRDAAHARPDALAAAD